MHSLPLQCQTLMPPHFRVHIHVLSATTALVYTGFLLNQVGLGLYGWSPSWFEFPAVEQVVTVFQITHCEVGRNVAMCWGHFWVTSVMLNMWGFGNRPEGSQLPVLLWRCCGTRPGTKLQSDRFGLQLIWPQAVSRCQTRNPQPAAEEKLTRLKCSSRNFLSLSSLFEEASVSVGSSTVVGVISWEPGTIIKQNTPSVRHHRNVSRV